MGLCFSKTLENKDEFIVNHFFLQFSKKLILKRKNLKIKVTQSFQSDRALKDLCSELFRRKKACFYEKFKYEVCSAPYIKTDCKMVWIGVQKGCNIDEKVQK